MNKKVIRLVRHMLQVGGVVVVVVLWLWWCGGCGGVVVVVVCWCGGCGGGDMEQDFTCNSGGTMAMASEVVVVGVTWWCSCGDDAVEVE